MEAETGKGSLFGALRRASEPPLASATPVAQEPSLQPVLERLEKIETQLSAGPAEAAEAADSARALLLKRIEEILSRTAAQEALFAAAIQESRERQKAWEDRVAGELLGRILRLEERLK